MLELYCIESIHCTQKLKQKSRERQNGESERERKEQRRGYTESNQSSNSQGIIRTSDVARVTEG